MYTFVYMGWVGGKFLFMAIFAPLVLGFLLLIGAHLCSMERASLLHHFSLHFLLFISFKVDMRCIFVLTPL